MPQLKHITNFIWSDDSATEFQCALSSDQIQNCISKFNNIQIQQNQTSVDDAPAELSNIFISAATMSLKRRFKKIRDKPKKKWFDANLHKVRGNLDSLHEENPKFYWNIVNELQGKSEKSTIINFSITLQNFV